MENADSNLTLKVEADTKDAEAALERLAKLNERVHHGRSGWHSTKLHLALIGMAMLTVVFVFVVLITGGAAGFGEYTIGMVTLAAGYSGSRVAESFAARRAPQAGP
jgi:hypothetical protein